MARDPAARYPSADELATDVRRWLADEPVRGVPRAVGGPGGPVGPAAPDRGRRGRPSCSRRRPSRLSAGAGLIWREEQKTAEKKREAEANLVLARQEQERADGERDRANRERDLARANFEQAWELAVTLGDVAGQAETGQAAAPADEPRRRELLAKALAACRRALEARPDDADMRERTARMLRYSANLGRFLNDTGPAEEAYRESVGIQRGLLARDPTDARAEHLGRTLRDYAALQRRTGRLTAAAATLDESAGIAERLWKADRESFQPQFDLAAVLMTRHTLEMARGRPADALRTAERCRSLFDDLLAGPPRDRSHPYAPMFRAETWAMAAVARRELARGDPDADALDAALKDHDTSTDLFRTLLAADERQDFRFHHLMALTERGRTGLLVPARREAAAKDLDEAVGGWR